MSGSVGILADPHGLTGVTPIGQRKLVIIYMSNPWGILDEKEAGREGLFTHKHLNLR